MQLLLIRHGETDWNVHGRMQGLTDTPLNERGRAQACRLAARLATIPTLCRIYSSPLSRARATAEIIGQETGLEPIFDDRLLERSAGPFEGLTSLDLEKQCPDLFRKWRKSHGTLRVPGIEDRATLQRRVQDFLGMLRERPADPAVAVVTHGGTLAMMLATLFKMDIQTRLPFQLDNASLTIVDEGASGTCLLLLNDTFHFGAVPVDPLLGGRQALPDRAPSFHS